MSPSLEWMSTGISGLLWPMAMADALAVLPPGPGAAAGAEVDVLLLD